MATVRVLDSSVSVSKAIFRNCAPELGGVALLALLLASLRLRGDRTGVVDEEAWEAIKNEWPILLTADSLLSLQAMVRLLICVSLVLRTSSSSRTTSSLIGEPAMLLCLGNIARALLVWWTAFYALDGPIGGNIPWAAECATAVLSGLLAVGVLRKSIFSLTLVVLASAWFSSRNRLSLGESPMGDSLFILAHTLEMLSAFAYCIRTLLIVTESGVMTSTLPTGFIHALMVLQQAMPAYYFTVAFECSDELVDMGQPVMILKYGSLAGLGAMLAAFAVHVAVQSDEEESLHARTI